MESLKVIYQFVSEQVKDYEALLSASDPEFITIEDIRRWKAAQGALIDVLEVIEKEAGKEALKNGI